MVSSITLVSSRSGLWEQATSRQSRAIRPRPTTRMAEKSCGVSETLAGRTQSSCAWQSDVSTAQLAAIGALLSGTGSVLGACLSVRIARKKLIEECEQRLKIFKDGLNRGLQLDEVEDSEKWSHLP